MSEYDNKKIFEIASKMIIKRIAFYSRLILGKPLRLLPLLLIGMVLIVWFWKEPISGRGGLPVFGRIEIPVPPFFQEDVQWAKEPLGYTSDTMGASGCAVSAAAMVLAFYGAAVDPQKLNVYLREHLGYEGAGWLKWEVAADYPPAEANYMYEDLPSYGLIDWNLLHGNPVIVRIRRANGNTHFVVIVGKQGLDYLVRDPAPKGKQGVYLFFELGAPIEALRYYRKKQVHFFKKSDPIINI